MKKKVGIITFFRPINYGAVLQALSSQIILNKFDYEVEIIDYRFKRIEKYRKLMNFEDYKKNLKKPQKIIKLIGLDILFYNKKRKQKNNFDKFLNNYLCISSKKYISGMDLKEDANQYTTFIVGSDLVWSPEMTDGLDAICFLDFIKNNENIKKISYAPSIGITRLDEKYLKLYEKNLQNFDFISVREKSAEKLLQPLTDKKITTVLDPSLLTNENDWKKFEDKKFDENKYILSFMLEYSPILIKSVCDLSDNTGLKIIGFDLKNYYGNRKWKSYYDCGPDTFLSLIKNAEYIITNSFHGCAFSIIYKKNFWCIPHTIRGIRMIELLEKLKIENRIVNENSIIDPNNKLNYNKIYDRLSILKNDSLSFLKKSLGDNNVK